MNKRGQGLPLNTIIIAIIVLVVLVVLIAIFVGRIGRTEQDLDREGNLELTKLKLEYETCHPDGAAESSFTQQYGPADPAQKQILVNEFKALIRSCSQLPACTGAPATGSRLGGCSN